MPRPIAIANRHPRLRLDRRAVARAIHLLDEHFAAPAPRARARSAPLRTAPPGELSLVFLTDAALAGLHADFLSDPTVTDVITFEGDAAFGTAGEICVSVDAALRQRPGSRAFSAELALYLVHGWLHLAGYDDLRPAAKRAMRRAENRALRLLTAASALPVFTLRPASRRPSRSAPRPVAARPAPAGPPGSSTTPSILPNLPSA